MKKLRPMFAVILSLLLSVSGVAGAEIAPGKLLSVDYPVDFGSARIEAFVRFNDLFVLLDVTNDRIALQTPDGGVSEYRSNRFKSDGEVLSIRGLLPQGERLFALEGVHSDMDDYDPQEMRLYEITELAADGYRQEKIAALDWFDFFEPEELYFTAALAGDRLAVVTSQGEAVLFDLSDGSGRRLEGEIYEAVFPLGGDAYALLEIRKGDYDHSYLHRMSTESDVPLETAALDLQANGFAVAPDGAIYFNASYTLFSYRFGDPEGARSIGPFPLESVSYACICDSMYLASWNGNVTAYSLLPQEEKTLAVAYDIMDRSLLEEYMQAHPSVRIHVADAHKNTAIIDDLLTQSDAVDVYVLSSTSSPAFRTARDRGYLYPLEDGALQDFASRLYPELQREITADGQLCAVPLSAYVQPCALGVNAAAWAALGLDPADIPASWEALMAFIARDWPALQESALDRGYYLMRENNFIMLPTLFLNNRISQGPDAEDRVYSTPAMVEIYGLYQQALMDEVYAPNDVQGEALFCEWDLNPEALNAPDYSRLPLTLGGMEVYPTVTMEVMALNPYSRNKEEALNFIRYCVEHMSPLDRLRMSPGENAPLQHENYEQDVQMFQENMENWERQINATESDVERALLLEEKARFQAKGELSLEANRWLVSAEAVERYRRDISGFTVYYNFILEEAEERKLSNLLEQFETGRIDAASYAARLDQAITMSNLEEQS